MKAKLIFALQHPLVTLQACNAAVDHLMSNWLSRAAVSLSSDKGIPGHGYTRVYLRQFAPLRETARHVLEIGLLRDDSARKTPGANRHAPSLCMWAAYFPNAKITGFDIDDFSGFSHPRCAVVQGDQSSRADLSKLAETMGDARFDIIIDDGSHVPSHQQITLGALFPFLSPGGLYCIEDLHFQPRTDADSGVPATLSLLKHLQAGKPVQSPALTDPEARYLQRHVDEIDFYDSLRPDIQGRAALAVIRKTPASSG